MTMPMTRATKNVTTSCQVFQLRRCFMSSSPGPGMVAPSATATPAVIFLPLSDRTGAIVDAPGSDVTTAAWAIETAESRRGGCG